MGRTDGQTDRHDEATSHYAKVTGDAMSVD
jgi:hypothetical protein